MSFEKSWFVLPYEVEPLTGFRDANVRFPEALATKFIEEYTNPQDVVFDPFAGFGTTLRAAQKLGRIGIGVEYDQSKVTYIQEKIEAPSKVLYGSSLELDSFDLPEIDLCFSSPPYMRSFDTENPLSNYTEEGSYASYLLGIGQIYAKIQTKMKPGAPVIVEISNTFDAKHPMTPLAWDVGKEISKHLHFERDYIFCFENGTIENPSDDNTHSYCLLFRNL